MATKKFKTHCRITDYLAAEHPKVAELLNGTCANGAVNNLRDRAGVTFLIPDAATLAKIEKLAYSNDPTEVHAAADMLNAHTLRDVFKTPGDWKTKQVANALLPAQLVDVASTSATEVVFKSGAKAVIDPGFIDGSRKKVLAVWKLTGEMPVTTDKPATIVRQKKTGGYTPGPTAESNLRNKIAVAVENAYAYECLGRDMHGRSASISAYLRASMGLVNYLLNIRNDQATLLDRVLPLVSCDYLDFYLLVEPHRYQGPFLLTDDLIADWWVNHSNARFDHRDLMSQINSLLTDKAGAAAIYTDRVAILDATMKLRRSLCEVADSAPRSIVDKIEVAYAALDSGNSIGGVSNVYPAGLAAYYAANPGLKMRSDELRYLSYGAFAELEASPLFDRGRFNTIIQMIADITYVAPNGGGAASKLLNKNILATAIWPTERVDEIKIFVYSTMFMYIPLTASEAANLKYKSAVSRPDPHNITVFNIAKNLFTRHKRLLEAVPRAENEEVARLLKSLNPDTLDPALRELLRTKFA